MNARSQVAGRAVGTLSIRMLHGSIYTCSSWVSEPILFPSFAFLRSPRLFSPPGRETTRVMMAAILAAKNATDRLLAYAASAGPCKAKGILESAVFECRMSVMSWTGKPMFNKCQSRTYTQDTHALTVWLVFQDLPQTKDKHSLLNARSNRHPYSIP